MDRHTWVKRIKTRSDFSMRLIHLTKESEIDGIKYDAMDILIKILKEKCLIGSTTESGFICGSRQAVCFQDAPLYSVSQNIEYEKSLRKNGESNKIRYRGYGLLFEKTYIYQKGGRPVIYDKTTDAKSYLPKDQWWRIVNLDLSNDNNIIDWMHEREWRVPDNLEFELSKLAVIVPSHKKYKEFIERCREIKDVDILLEIKSIINLGALSL